MPAAFLRLFLHYRKCGYSVRMALALAYAGAKS